MFLVYSNEKVVSVVSAITSPDRQFRLLSFCCILSVIQWDLLILHLDVYSSIYLSVITRQTEVLMTFALN